MNNVIKVICVLLVTGCSEREPEVQPFSGPGYDPELGLLDPQEEYLVGITHLRVRNLPGPGKRFGEHADAVATWLYDNEPEGWVGASFRNVGKLDCWTITVWESEEAQLAFVVSDVHGAAMGAVDDVSRGAESRSLWVPAAEVPLDWDTALDRLAETQDYTFGEP
jgi:hypothetical protein